MTGEAWHEPPAVLDFEEPSDPKPKKKTKKHKKTREQRALLPVTRLPDRPEPQKSTEVVRGVSQRARACVNMRLEGASFLEIADVLEYESAQDAKRDCERALAATHPPEDWETMRQMATIRAERQLAESLKFARADYLLNDDGEKVPNADKIRWHQQASSDLMNFVTISGAKAPTKVEITPGEAHLEQLVNELLIRGGHVVTEESDVLELTAMPPTEDDDGLDLYAE